MPRLFTQASFGGGCGETDGLAGKNRDGIERRGTRLTGIDGAMVAREAKGQRTPSDCTWKTENRRSEGGWIKRMESR